MDILGLFAVSAAALPPVPLDRDLKRFVTEVIESKFMLPSADEMLPQFLWTSRLSGSRGCFGFRLPPGDLDAFLSSRIWLMLPVSALRLDFDEELGLVPLCLLLSNFSSEGLSTIGSVRGFFFFFFFFLVFEGSIPSAKSLASSASSAAFTFAGWYEVMDTSRAWGPFGAGIEEKVTRANLSIGISLRFSTWVPWKNTSISPSVCYLAR